MSGNDDAENIRRNQAPYTARHQIPTIKKFREEQEARKAEARDYEGEDSGPERSTAERLSEWAGRNESEADDQVQAEGQQQEQQQHEGQQRDPGAQQSGHVEKDGGGGTEAAVDTSEVDMKSMDPKQRRKDLQKGKEQRAEREVTDPVTHLPVRIHDLTSKALEEVPKNEPPFGSTTRTATGLSNKTKSSKQLQDESKGLQDGYNAMQSLFPSSDVEYLKQELEAAYKIAIIVGAVGAAIIVVLVVGLQKLVGLKSFTTFSTDQRLPAWLIHIATWSAFATIAGVCIWALIYGTRDWMAKRVDGLLDDEVWEAHGDVKQGRDKAHETETVVWLNSLLGSVWPLVNPDLFTSLADTLEDVMQASLPRMVQMVSVNDIGQGSESLRILGVRWLPTGAAAQAVSEDGTLQKNIDSEDQKGPGEGEVKKEDNKKTKGEQEKTQQAEDGSQQEVAAGLEAEEGDFVNMEVAFAYRARSKKKSMKDRAKDMHLYIAFYLPGNIKLPVWVDLRGIVGTMRMRLQLCPDPPFFSLCTITFLGQPKVDISCTPLSKHAVNIMDVPLISNFVQSAVDAAMAEYVAPKSLNLDLKDMLAGDDFKKDTNARGVLVIHVKRGYDFRKGDAGIPLVKDGSSDPYVSVGWAKFGKPVWSTRLLLNEMEPWWDETAYVLVTAEELNVGERLRLQLWDSDRLTADDDLGRIEVDLKEIMKQPESNGQMWSRTDGFRALKAGEGMPGKLEWEVGYFSKAKIQGDQLQRQTFDPELRTMEQMKEKVNQICERKLREANIKEGRHNDDADELEQQKEQELKGMQDCMIISAPPPEGFPSGIFSIQIHQITGLELEKISKVETEKSEEANEEEEEGEGLPSAFCTIIINHSKAFKTRTKPKNAKPFYNAGTERFIPDWRNAEVFISVRDARVKEDSPLLGIVHLPLEDVFHERSQINGFYPLTGGIGFGRIRLSMVWRSIQLQAPVEALGWEFGTVDIQTNVPMSDVPEELKDLKLKFHTDLGSGKMYAGKENKSWNTKNDQSLKLPVRRRYSSCLALQFRHHGVFHDKIAAFAVLWLKNIPDEEEREVTVPVWKGDYERATKNAIPECGEKVGSITLKLTFWNGLGAAHSKWATKDHTLGDVVEVLETAHNNDETLEHEKEVGIVDGNATDSSSDEDSADDEAKANGDGHSEDDHPGGVKGFKKHHDVLNKQNRGLMQWKFPRSARWAAHKLERTESRFSDMFKHHTRQSGVETEV